MANSIAYGTITISDLADGAQIWTSSAAPNTPDYTFTISNLNTDGSADIKVGDLIFYDTYRYTVTSVGSTTVLASYRTNLGGLGLYEMIPYYLASSSSSGVTRNTPGWSTSIPTLTATNKYLWVYYVSRYGAGEPQVLTASGGVATFKNNGDAYYTEGVTIDIVPLQTGSGDPTPTNVRSISGWTGANISTTGKNIFNDSAANWKSGYLINDSGNEASQTNYKYSQAYTRVNAETEYVLQINKAATAVLAGTVIFYDANQSFISRSPAIPATASTGVLSGSFVTPAGCAFIRINVPKTDTTNIQIEPGSTKTDYEAFGATTQVSWTGSAGTVYGGTLNYTTGVLTAEYALIALDGTQSVTKVDDGYFYLSIGTDGIANNNYALSSTGWCSHYNVVTDVHSTNALKSMPYSICYNNYTLTSVSGRTFIVDGRYTSASDLQAYFQAQNSNGTPVQLIYKLSTPVTYQLTAQAITSLVGVNNIFTDVGNTTVFYYENQKVTDPVIIGVHGANGYNSATLYLYKRGDTAPAKPTGAVTYNFANNTLTESTTNALNGWSQTIDSSSTNPVWMISATAISNTDSDEIGSTEWSTQVRVFENGTDATAYNQATIYIYQRAASAPTAPTGITYNFTTGTLSGTLGSWSREIPATNENHDPCYVTSASVVSTDTTSGTITWAAVVKLVEDGQNGVMLYGTSSTAASTAAKVVACTDATELYDGLTIFIDFSTANTANAPTLNVNSKGAKAIYFNGAAASSTNQFLWAAGAKIQFTYYTNSGTGYWVPIGHPCSYYGTGSVAAATAAKTSTINQIVVCKGTSVSIRMTYTNTNASPTLNVTSTGAKAIYVNNAQLDATSIYNWPAGATATFVFDGQHWCITDTAGTYLANAAKETADGKITTFYQPETPTANVVGDLWIDTTNNENSLKRWNGTTWVAVDNANLQAALNLAGAAAYLADSKIVTFAQTTAPSSDDASLGDLWIDTDDNNKMYRWNGSSWVDVASVVDVGGTNLWIVNASTFGYMHGNGSITLSSAVHHIATSMRRYIPVTAGERFVYQHWNPTLINDTTNYGQVAFYNSSKTHIKYTDGTAGSGNYELPKVSAANGDYVVRYFVAPPNAAFMRIGLCYANGMYDFRAKVERGNTPTAYSPAPEDIEAQAAGTSSPNLCAHTKNPKPEDVVRTSEATVLVGDDGTITLQPGGSATYVKWKSYIGEGIPYSECNGNTYSVSFDAKRGTSESYTAEKQLLVYMGINVADRYETQLLHKDHDYYRAQYTNVFGDWKRYRCSFVVPSTFETGTNTALVDTNYLVVQFGAESAQVPIIIKNIKLELGDLATEYAPAVEDTENAITAATDDARYVNEELGKTNEAIRDINTNIQGQSEDIEGLYDLYRAQSSQTSTLNNGLVNYKETVNQRLNKLDANSELIGGHIAIVDDPEQNQYYIDIGRQKKQADAIHDFHLKLEGDRMVFYDGDTAMAYFQNSQLFTQDAIFSTRAKIGNFAFIPRATGNLSFMYVGGN